MKTIIQFKKFRLWRERRDAIWAMLWVVRNGLRTAREFEFKDEFGPWNSGDGPLLPPSRRGHTITIKINGGAPMRTEVTWKIE